MIKQKNNFIFLRIFFSFIIVLSIFTSCKRKVITDPKPFSLLGSNWINISQGTYESVNPLNYLYIDSAGSVYVWGKAKSVVVGGNAVNYDYVTKWNGTSWAQLGADTNIIGSIRDLCKDNSGNFYVGSSSGVIKWNGISWNNLVGLSSGAIWSFQSLVFNPKNGYLYASIIKAVNPYLDCDIYYWNGSSWNVLDNSSSKLNRVAIKLYVDNNGDLYAGGNFTNSSGNYYVAKWSGTNWVELGLGGNELKANSYIRTISCDNVGNIYASGDFTNANGNFYVAKWDGASWTELGGNNSLAANGRITSICVDALGNLYAAGAMSYRIDEFDNCYYVAKWNGNTWSIVGKNSLYASGMFNQIVVNSTGTIYAVGSFTNTAKNRYVGRYP